MSTAPAMAPSAAAAGHLSFVRVLRSEFIKLRSLRSTWVMLASMLVLFIAFGAIAALASTGAIDSANGGPPRSAFIDPVTTVLAGGGFAVLIMSVLGVLSGAREYGSGMIRTSLTFVPKRLPVLWAKVLVLIAFVVPVAVLAALGAFVLGMALLSGAGSDTVTLGDPDAQRVLIGTCAYITGLAVIGLALGMAMRSMPGAIATVIGGVLILPALLTALLPDAWRSVLKFLPSNAAAAFTEVRVRADMLELGPGIIVFTAWVILSVVVAAVLLARRDA
ncbi:MAG: ABC transporter permease [Candidatus Nanopelagicales bacterium]|nr:ABC transporter permease [Candidatus Nanopelagicales bacterium]